MSSRLLPIVVVALLLGGCSLLTSIEACFAPKAERLDSPMAEELVQAKDQPGASTTFDHARYDGLLRRHVRPDTGRVDYAGLKADEASLDTYLATLARADLKTLGRDAQMALLINAYNAATLKLIVEAYPGLESIRDLDDPWGTRRWVVGGEALSLDDLEHRLLRPVYRDPRIHFAVNCASIGCPPLAASAYTGPELEEQLRRATEQTLSDPVFARLEGGTLYLTSLLNWYGADFVDPDYAPRAESLPAWIVEHGPAALGERVAAVADVKVRFVDYDWGLNDLDAADRGR